MQIESSIFAKLAKMLNGGTAWIQTTGRAFRVANLVFPLSRQDVLATVSNYASPRNADRRECLLSLSLSRLSSRVNRRGVNGRHVRKLEAKSGDDTGTTLPKINVRILFHDRDLNECKFSRVDIAVVFQTCPANLVHNYRINSPFSPLLVECLPRIFRTRLYFSFPSPLVLW